MGEVIALPPRTYVPKCLESRGFMMSGTLDGFIDLKVPLGMTYLFSLDEAEAFVASMQSTINDVKKNCLYDRDALLEPVFREDTRGADV